MTDITIRWPGPSDATSSSTYQIERTLNNSSWSVLAAAQASSSPYVSVSNTLSGSHAYGVATVSLTSATSFSSAGYGWLDDALIQWAGKSSNDLTGVTWHSGYGTYAAGTVLREAHEDYADTGVTISNNAVLYRITHTDSSGRESAPAYLWYYSPPIPSSSEHCVVVVGVNADLGIEARASISVDAYLASSDYTVNGGVYLDSGEAAAKRQTTNAFGLAFFQCWKSSARVSNSAYTFDVDADDSSKETISIDTIPDRDWILLVDII